MSETEIEEMFDVADTDRDGIIGYPEFMVRVMYKYRSNTNNKYKAKYENKANYKYKVKYDCEYGTKYESC